jgi:hypothetical protein
MAEATPLSVSKALGHQSLTTIYRHYADKGITQRQEHERAMECLSPPTGAGPNSHAGNEFGVTQELPSDNFGAVGLGEKQKVL